MRRRKIDSAHIQYLNKKEEIKIAFEIWEILILQSY